MHVVALVTQTEVSSLAPAPNSRKWRLNRVTHVIGLALAAAIISLFAVQAQADERSDYLMRLLQTSSAFRVRAQAAISLGSVPAQPEIVAALTAALRDSEGSVRAAAASSLGRLGDPSAISALNALSRDSSPQVRAAATDAITALRRGPAPGVAASSGTTGGTSVAASGTTGTATGPARFYVGIGVPGTRVASADAGVVQGARAHIERTVGAMSGVVVAPEGETVATATRVLRARSLVGFYVDSSVTALDARPDGSLRASVSVVVQDYPGRNVRSMLTGSATVSGEQGPTAQRTAIEAALGSALRNLGTAMNASAPRR